MARRPTGLAAPRVSESALQQWIDSVTRRIAGLDGEITDMAEAVAGAQAGVELISQAEVGVGACLIAPQPQGVEGFGGIGIVMITWENPLRACSNFANATIYRNTVDDFITATMIGQSQWLSYIDEQVLDDTTYYYWVAWTLTNGSVGPPSESVEAETGIDPERFYEMLLNDLETDPLARELLADITLPASIAAEMRRLSDQKTLILADLLGLTSRNLESAQADITALEARVTGTSLGPPQNLFSGPDRTAAENARNVYQATNPMVAFDGVTQPWLAHYDGDDDLNIRLSYGVILQYQRRVSGAWVDNGEEQPTASAVAALSADVMVAEGEIATNAVAITALEATTGISLGPTPNSFTGAGEFDAEIARDDYAGAHPTWLMDYDNNPDNAIELTWA